ncbi:DNA-binding domain-containing protein [Carboxylicivirga sp. M1479]|uniref:DNA-binding domain-containing protein n=1 Tax=Carboxylicivirga sp. M1479 TaxID=2594476 RepID=UPI0011777885|nr:DNA-binding domain-containing protein [Carboxylicivirga sp. M1479]TRX65759.1 hypothetical protein FNN09_16770 [Carboxylicivirga sp. M1479]
MKFALYPNTLKTAKKGSCIGKIQLDEIVDTRKLIQQMSERGSGIRESEALACITEFFAVIEDNLKNGCGVNTPLFKIKPSLRGTFDGFDDKYNASKHQVVFNISRGKLLKDLSGKVKPDRSIPRSKSPEIKAIIDVKSQMPVTQLSPYGVLRVRGNNFLFPMNDDKAGVYLNNTSTSVRLTILSAQRNELIVVLPAIVTDFNHIEILTRPQHHSDYMRCTYKVG